MCLKSHGGKGIFKRLLRSTKRLRKILSQAKLSYVELLTAIAEVESVLNSRPLTYVSAEDLEEPLTPSHLLFGRRIMSLPDHLLEDDDDFSGQVLNNRLNISTALWIPSGKGGEGNMY